VQRNNNFDFHQYFILDPQKCFCPALFLQRHEQVGPDWSDPDSIDSVDPDPGREKLLKKEKSEEISSAGCSLWGSASFAFWYGSSADRTTDLWIQTRILLFSSVAFKMLIKISFFLHASFFCLLLLVTRRYKQYKSRFFLLF
jgi:hypothetical protein